MFGTSSDPEKVDDPLDERGFRQILRRSTTVLCLSLGIPFVALLCLVLFLLNSANWVDHTDRAISMANGIEKNLVTMQSSFRGYRLANDEKFLDIHFEARIKVGPEYEKLSQHVADNVNQSTLIREAREASETWMEFVDTEIDKVRTGQSAASDPRFMQKSIPLFDNLIHHLETFISREERLRALRAERLDLISKTLVLALLLGALIGIPCLAVWLQRRLRKVNEAYKLSNAEAHQRASELFVTLKSIGDAVVATDANGMVTFLNPVAEKLMGCSTLEAKGRPLTEVFDIYNEQTGEVTENPVDRVLRENIVVGLANHTVLRSCQGSEVPIEDSAAPIRDEQGAVIGVILVFHDVSENRLAENLLQASEERFRFLNELGESTRSITDPTQIMERVTRLLGEHLKVSRCAYADVSDDNETFVIPYDHNVDCSSIVGSYKLSLFGPDAGKKMRTGETLVINDMDVEVDAKDGGETFNSIAVKSIICCPMIKEGKLRAMMAVHQTSPRKWSTHEIQLVEAVVERCWATIERARAESDLRLLSELVSLQVWMANPEGELDYANHECLKYFGADLKNILGNAWAQFVHPEDLDRALHVWKASLVSGERYEVEFRLRHWDGKYRWFLVRAEAQRDNDGGIVKWLGTNTEIQNLKMAQYAAEAASQSKDSFLAALSHELRTPLTPVLMAAAKLRDDTTLPASVRQELGMMHRNIALEGRLIDDLLDLTAIVRGKTQLRTQPCDVHSLIGLAIDIVRDEAQAKGISIQRELDASRSGLMADASRFQQVMWNLLRNAVKFTPKGGQIVIRTFNHPNDWLGVEVSDTGMGIPQEALEKIFLPFEQGDPQGAHRFGGLGLGLAIARAIVDLHGGVLTARSAGENQGATFSIELPGVTKLPHDLESRLLSDEEAKAHAKEATRTKSASILLVEDHADSIEILSRLLTSTGVRVVTAMSVKAALDAAAKNKFDLVISDLGLPDGTGNELMEKLRDSHGLRGIALSGYGMEEDIDRSKRAGFVAHLIKPVDFKQLSDVLKNLI